MFDLFLSSSLLLFLEPVLEFFVFPPGGVALTGQIQNTQTSCSTTPVATVSKPPLLSACGHHCFLLLHQTHLSPWLPRHIVISMAITQTSCCHTHLSPWLPPCMLVSLATALHSTPLFARPPLCYLDLLTQSLDLTTSKPVFQVYACVRVCVCVSVCTVKHIS